MKTYGLSGPRRGGAPRRRRRRELLGEMLLELKRPADALKEFEASQGTRPELVQARAYLAANP